MSAVTAAKPSIEKKKNDIRFACSAAAPPGPNSMKAGTVTVPKMTNAVPPANSLASFAAIPQIYQTSFILVAAASKFPS
jgi:hypothetical protein